MSSEAPSQDETYKHFTDLYDIPYTIVTFAYIIALLMISVVVAAKKISKYCKCCQSCCNSLEGSKARKWMTDFNSWLVRLIFGRSEGISTEENDGKEADTTLQASRDEAGVTRVYVQDQKMAETDVNILGTIILCFVLLMAIAAYGVYLLEVTHTCSEDTAIYCFPRFIDEDNPNNPNITRDEMMYPITDCSLWVNSSVAPLITFQCFRYAYNAQAALATAGGLLALFTVAMRVTITIFRKIFKWFRSCGTCLVVLQVVTVIILLVFDVGVAVVVMAFQLYSQLGSMEAQTTPAAQQTASYIADNGLQFLVIMGTTTLLLLIPWSQYIPPDTEAEKDRHSLELKERP